MIIGITGKIASGKSYIEKLVSRSIVGSSVIDLDILSKTFYYKKPNKLLPLINKNVSYLYMDDGVTIDFKKISDIIFSDSVKLKKIEKIIHAEIYKYLSKLNSSNLYIVSSFNLKPFEDLIPISVEIRSNLFIRIIRILKRKQPLNKIKRMWIQRKIKYNCKLCIGTNIKDLRRLVDILRLLN